jgi:CRP-like cAMP-binding protein
VWRSCARSRYSLKSNGRNWSCWRPPASGWEYQSGHELFHQGDYGDAAYIVLEGKADILVDSANGAVTVVTLGKENIIGEIAILCDVPRTATVVAQGDLQTLRVPKAEFLHLVTQLPQVGIELMRALASKLDHATQALIAARDPRSA